MKWLERFLKLAAVPGKPEAVSKSSVHVASARVLQERALEAAAHMQRGNEWLGKSQFNEAAKEYRLAISADPENGNAHVNLGFVLIQGRQLQAALEPLRQGLKLLPASHDAHYLLGTVLLAQHAYPVAIDHLEQALVFKPDLTVAYRDLGKALHDIGQHERAKSVLNTGLTIDPQFADLYYFRGNIELHLMEIDKALTSYKRALAIDPGYAAVHSNKAQALLNLCEYAEAAAAARKALALDPSMLVARSNLLMTLSSDGQCSPAEYLIEARQYSDQLAARIGSHAITRSTGPRISLPDGSRLLRIGFVSGDLHNHPVGFFLDNVMAYWNSTLAMETIAYSNHPGQDELTARLKARFGEWRDVSAMDDMAAAEQIEFDRVDVLIDLSGHTPENRLPVFARRPAPVQVSWLGYWASTGLSTMDWLLADPVSIPPDQRANFTESIWYLPETRLCFTPPSGLGVPAVSNPPALQTGQVTFGSFQRVTKLNDDVLALWARVLQAVPGSRLRLQSKQMQDETARARLLQRLEAVGIEPQRVQLVEASERLAYLAAHAAVDIILDTFPHTGATTTCEALWMGVPTLTLAGTTMLARQGASLLGCAGLAGWVATNEDDYIALAVQHASDLDALRSLRLGLREQVEASPVFNAERFAANLQTAIRNLWRKSERPSP
ncbi:MAG: tetratricopeptide repeat protein [Rhizobacter sp.]